MDDVFQHSSRLYQLEMRFVRCETIEMTMPKAVRSNRDQRMPGHLAQFFFREITVAIHETSHYKKGDRQRIFFQNWQRYGQVVAISIIKGDRNQTLAFLFEQGLDQRHNPAAARKPAQLLFKALRRNHFVAG